MGQAGLGLPTLRKCQETVKRGERTLNRTNSVNGSLSIYKRSHSV